MDTPCHNPSDNQCRRSKQQHGQRLPVHCEVGYEGAAQSDDAGDGGAGPEGLMMILICWRFNYILEGCQTEIQSLKSVILEIFLQHWSPVRVITPKFFDISYI